MYSLIIAVTCCHIDSYNIEMKSTNIYPFDYY